MFLAPVWGWYNIGSWHFVSFGCCGFKILFGLLIWCGFSGFGGFWWLWGLVVFRSCELGLGFGVSGFSFWWFDVGGLIGLVGLSILVLRISVPWVLRVCMIGAV